MLNTTHDEEMLLHKQEVIDLLVKMEANYLYGLEDYKVEFIKLAPINHQDELVQMFINGVLPDDYISIDKFWNKIVILLHKRKSKLALKHQDDIKNYISSLEKNTKIKKHI